MSAMEDEFIRIAQGKALVRIWYDEVTRLRHKAQLLKFEWDCADHWDPDRLEGIQSRLDNTLALLAQAEHEVSKAEATLFNPARKAQS